MSELAQVLRHVLPVEDPNVLIGHETGDDAAVYRLTDDRALVVTADFFTPIVDDPYDFGRIAATNALSDIYAMGAKPLFVLNLVGFPRTLLSTGTLEEILRGGSDVTRHLGIPTLGGHTIDDPEPKYGLVAIGEVHPDEMVTNAGARPGDALVLTKPIGSGVIATAIKKADPDPGIVRDAIEVMATLNHEASQAMRAEGLVAGTDVTGFGLLGHLRSLTRASGVSARVQSADVRLMNGARDLARAGHIASGSRRNLDDLADDLDFADSVDELTRILLADAQTSGGMLMCVPQDRLAGLLERLAGSPSEGFVIGEITEGRAGSIRIE